YGRPRTGGAPFFTPADERSQTALGERVIGVFRDAGAEVIAEDLGTVPDFVRDSLGRLGVPGFRVLRWERFWHTEGQPFRDMSSYPPASVATSGTHDTETLADWWQTTPPDFQRGVSDLPTVQKITGGRGLLGRPYMPEVRDALLEALFASGSNLVLLPVQDVFGWRDRINEPAVVSRRNWTFRLPWTVDRLDAVDEARERQTALAGWARRYGRI